MTIPFADFNPTLPKQDGAEVVFTIPAPDLAKLRVDYKSHLRFDGDAIPGRVFEEYAQGLMRAAFVAAYAPHFKALHTQHGLTKQYPVTVDGYRECAIGKDWDKLLVLNIDHTGSGYYRGPLGIVVRPERTPGLRQRKFDFRATLALEGAKDLLNGRDTVMTVSSKWSKIWETVSTLLTAVVEARRVRKEAEDLVTKIEREEKAASQRVVEALAKVESTQGEYRSDIRYSYGANVTARRQADGSYRFTLALGDGRVDTPRVHQDLARKLVAALPHDAQLHLTIDNLTDVDAAAILQMLPQKGEA